MRYIVLVKPGSKVEKIEQNDDTIIVRTHAKAHDGEANKAVIELLSDYLHVPKTQITIVSGLKSKRKIIEIASR